MGLELLEQIPDLDAILVPASGGGMAAGISVAAKALKPDIKSEKHYGYTVFIYWWSIDISPLKRQTFYYNEQ